MATTYVYTELPRKANVDQDGARTSTRSWSVRSSAPENSPGVVADALLAYLGTSQYSGYADGVGTDANAILKTIEATQTGDFVDWTVVCVWDSKPNARDKGSTSGTGPGGTPTPGATSQDKTPTNRPPVIKMGSIDKERPLATDYATPAVNVVNSAGVPFDPPVMLPATYPTISITVWRAAQNINKILQFVNSINLYAWTIGGMIIPAKRARCSKYDQVSTYENGAFFWQYDITVEISPDFVYNPLRILDAGVMQKALVDPTTKPLEHIKDNKMQPVSHPVPLDGAGRALNFGLPGQYLSFTGYREENFDNLWQN